MKYLFQELQLLYTKDTSSKNMWFTSLYFEEFHSFFWLYIIFHAIIKISRGHNDTRTVIMWFSKPFMPNTTIESKKYLTNTQADLISVLIILLIFNMRENVKGK